MEDRGEREVRDAARQRVAPAKWWRNACREASAARPEPPAARPHRARRLRERRATRRPPPPTEEGDYGEGIGAAPAPARGPPPARRRGTHEGTRAEAVLAPGGSDTGTGRS